MRNLLLLVFAVVATTINAQDLSTSWKNATHLKNEDGSVKLKVGGRIHYDWASFSEDDDLVDALGQSANGAEFRRARLYSSGTIYSAVKYKLQFDFAGGSPVFKDAYISIPKLPVVGNLTIGQFKEPFSLEELTSSNDITFLERSVTANFAPSRSHGIMVNNTIADKRATYAVGVFKDDEKQGNVTQEEDNYNVTARLTGLPVHNKDNNLLVHVGAAYSYRTPQFDAVSYSSRPDAHLANKYATASVTDADNVQLFNAELAVVAKAFSIQGEYTTAMIAGLEETDYNFGNYYVEASYFLTGESRVYDAKKGKFKRAAPKTNFNPNEKGAGAWQLAVRYANADYTDQEVGGKLTNITAGLNWYLNPATKFGVNHTISDLDEVGKANITQLRCQVVF